ncbi:MAG: hypothetical protein KUA30_08765 [Candidatus Desulforudis sp.]|nr:hypothetical protein [Desulforudis sp.]
MTHTPSTPAGAGPTSRAGGRCSRKQHNGYLGRDQAVTVRPVLPCSPTGEVAGPGMLADSGLGRKREWEFVSGCDILKIERVNTHGESYQSTLFESAAPGREVACKPAVERRAREVEAEPDRPEPRRAAALKTADAVEAAPIGG